MNFNPSQTIFGWILPPFSSWWFQPIWKIWVKLEIFTNLGVNKTYFKPPPSFVFWLFFCKSFGQTPPETPKVWQVKPAPAGPETAGSSGSSCGTTPKANSLREGWQRHGQRPWNPGLFFIPLGSMGLVTSIFTYMKTHKKSSKCGDRNIPIPWILWDRDHFIGLLQSPYNEVVESPY